MTHLTPDAVNTELLEALKSAHDYLAANGWEGDPRMEPIITALDNADILAGKEPSVNSLDTVEIVRGRLANGRTIADSDVRKLLDKIDQLQSKVDFQKQYNRELYALLAEVEAERDEAQKELEATRAKLKNREASLMGWVDFASGVIQDGTDLRKELEELLEVADWTYAGIARGECEQHLCSRLGPATAKARASLLNMTIGPEET
jgi:uncharacterized coiled-coil protein SlyX